MVAGITLLGIMQDLIGALEITFYFSFQVKTIYNNNIHVYM
jgi:hypothetical protein